MVIYFFYPWCLHQCNYDNQQTSVFLDPRSSIPSSMRKSRENWKLFFFHAKRAYLLKKTSFYFMLALKFIHTLTRNFSPRHHWFSSPKFFQSDTQKNQSSELTIKTYRPSYWTHANKCKKHGRHIFLSTHITAVSLKLYSLLSVRFFLEKLLPSFSEARKNSPCDIWRQIGHPAEASILDSSQ